MSEAADQLVDYAFGKLSGAERSAFEARLAESPDLQAELEALESTVSAMGTASFEAPELLSRLQKRLEGPARFDHFVGDIASLFDLSIDDSRILLAEISAGTGFEPGPADGVLIKPVAAGPLREGAVSAILKLEPNAVFPHHGHGAEEITLVIEGGYRDSSGIEVWRGDYDRRDPTQQHSFVALEGLPCLCAAVTYFPKDES